MRLIFKYLFAVPFFLLLGFQALAQDKIELVQAKELEGVTINGANVRKLKGNVIFKQGSTIMTCDSAYQYPLKNSIDAFGNVTINQGDTVFLSGKTLNYNGDTKRAKVRGNVLLKDKQMNLNTEALDYDMNSRVASYTNNGVIKDQETTLKSVKGFYSTQTKVFQFIEKVNVVNSVQKYTLTSDSLEYSTTTKVARFQGPTKIVTQDGVLFATEGEYETTKSISNFKGKAKVESGTYTLEGDKMFYDEKNKRGVVTNNVRLFSVKDKIIIEGDNAYYWGSTGISKVFGNAVMKTAVGSDTLYLSADTLISIDNEKRPQDKRLLAFADARIFKKDMQGICDSLVYHFPDSSIYFYKDPVLWSDKNQIEADSMRVLMVNNNISKMFLNLNSFIISKDTLSNYNQIKGKRMVAYFKDEEITRVNVNGNGESIYFALEEDTVLTGMNKVICSDMIIKFDSSKVSGISFIKKPDALFIPPHQIEEPETRLKGFSWRLSERPDKEAVIRGRKVSMK